jgi:hypothetical protein
MGRVEVENYPLFPKDVSFEEELEWVMEYRKLEEQMQKESCFTLWDPSNK